jgi:hypothetical protein
MKFFAFIIIVVALWYVMRWIQQAETARRILRDQQQRRTGGGARPASRMRTTETMACPRCGTYVPSEFPISCGRADCPYPGIG